MRLYIVRHAEAEERGPDTRDADRPLTPKGMKQSKSLGELFRKGSDPARVEPKAILSSPAARALQTATVIGVALKLPVSIDRGLGLDADAASIGTVVRRLIEADVASAVIVGHNPTFEDFANSLGAGGGMRKAEMIAVDVDVRGKQLVGKNPQRARGEG